MNIAGYIKDAVGCKWHMMVYEIQASYASSHSIHQLPRPNLTSLGKNFFKNTSECMSGVRRTCSEWPNSTAPNMTLARTPRTARTARSSPPRACAALGSMCCGQNWSLVRNRSRIQELFRNSGNYSIISIVSTKVKQWKQRKLYSRTQ